MTKELSTKIREARKSKGITQRQLADAIGVKLPTIAKYESGHINPPLHRVLAIAEFLQYDSSYFLSVENFDAHDYYENTQSCYTNHYLNIHRHLERIEKSDNLEEDKYLVYSDKELKYKVLEYSGHKCELCGNPAPFYYDNGLPHLEVHFIKWLSKGGLPTIDNAVALCPNCHKKIHVLNSAEDIEYLKLVANKHLNK